MTSVICAKWMWATEYCSLRGPFCLHQSGLWTLSTLPAQTSMTSLYLRSRDWLSFTIRYQKNLPESNWQLYDLRGSYLCGRCLYCGEFPVVPQVRCMMALLLLIGQKLEAPEIIDQLLDVQSNPRKPQYRYIHVLI